MSKKSSKKRCLAKRNLIIKLAQKENWICPYCKEQMVLLPRTARNAATIDHVLPKVLGGLNKLNNKMAVCANCNNLNGVALLWALRHVFPEVYGPKHDNTGRFQVVMYDFTLNSFIE